jgi:hypothetical protein
MDTNILIRSGVPDAIIKHEAVAGCGSPVSLGNLEFATTLTVLVSNGF